jgi:hypothetical protein
VNRFVLRLRAQQMKPTGRATRQLPMRSLRSRSLRLNRPLCAPGQIPAPRSAEVGRSSAVRHRSTPSVQRRIKRARRRGRPRGLQLERRQRSRQPNAQENPDDLARNAEHAARQAEDAQREADNAARRASDAARRAKEAVRRAQDAERHVKVVTRRAERGMLVLGRAYWRPSRGSRSRADAETWRLRRQRPTTALFTFIAARG